MSINSMLRNFNNMVEQKLSGVPETLFIPLCARGIETKHSKPIIKDYKAVD